MDTTVYQPSQNGAGQSHALSVVVNNTTEVVKPVSKPFIEANTVEGSLLDIRNTHIIPTFKDSEPLISQAEYIDLVNTRVHDLFSAERILSPSVRLSHPVMGRIPEAKNKPANELQEFEKTLHYSRCAFIIEIPSINDSIGGQPFCLTVGGVRAYDKQNLSHSKGANEHFKLFIGFKVRVCCNMVVWTDGAVWDFSVNSKEELDRRIFEALFAYDAISDLQQMTRMQDFRLSEQQFAHLIGKARMFQHIPGQTKTTIYDFPFGDTLLNNVCRGYYHDKLFGRKADESISLWDLHNLFTAANKQSYIDTFVDRAASASTFVSELQYAMERGTVNWFLS